MIAKMLRRLRRSAIESKQRSDTQVTFLSCSDQMHWEELQTIGTHYKEALEIVYHGTPMNTDGDLIASNSGVYKPRLEAFSQKHRRHSLLKHPKSRKTAIVVTSINLHKKIVAELKYLAMIDHLNDHGLI